MTAPSTWARFALTVGVLCVAAPLRAQMPRASGPFAGLFGGGRPAENSQRLDFRGSLFVAAQDVIVPSDVDPELLDPTFQQSGTISGATAGLVYGFNRLSDKTQFSFGGYGSVAEYSTNADQPQYGVGSTAALATRLTRRVVFNSTAGANYSPYYNLFGVPVSGGGLPFDPTSTNPNFAFALAAMPNVTAFASAGVTGNVSRHTRVGADTSLQQTFLLHDSSANLQDLQSGISLDHQIFRKLAFAVRYSHAEHRLMNGDRKLRQSTQNLEATLTYADALTLRLSRRTTANFGLSLGTGRSLRTGIHYVVLGNASLTHNMRRTWATSIQYSRSLGFMSGFSEPVLSDSATASLSGQLARRLSWVSMAGATHGQVGFDNAGSYVAYTASSGPFLAISKNIGAYALYSYYKSTVPAGLSTLPLLSSFGRQTAVVGLSLYSPIIGGRRTTN